MNSLWIERHDVDGVPSRMYMERVDGAYVWCDSRPCWESLTDPRCWIAFGPDQHYLSKSQKGNFRVPRRWKTAAAAIKAVDAEIPLKESKK